MPPGEAPAVIGLGTMFILFFVTLGPFKVLGPFVQMTGGLDEAVIRRISIRAFGLGVVVAVREASKIDGSIVADTARLAGHVKGATTVRQLVILKTAKIEGDVPYETLTIEQGATVNGRFAPDAAKVQAAAAKPAATAAPAAPKPQAPALDLDKEEPRITLAS